MSHSPTRYATWPGSALSAASSELSRRLAGLFRSTAPADLLEHSHIGHVALFIAILCGGAFVRFLGLGSVGLHGDEETMAMAVMHIVQDGRPILPSGMFYPRGLTQLYLMAGAVQLFGESEWALRLPSALCGVLLIALAYLAGRRFLRPSWNLAFTASVAFLPAVIVYSQTARMYIFMLASIAACMVCVFEWERSNRLRWLVVAVMTLMLGIDFQALTVTSVLLLLLPGVLHHDMRKLTYGLAAIAIVMVFYVLFDSWLNSHYPVPPPEFAADLGPPHWQRTPKAAPFALSFQIAAWVAAIAVASFALRFGRAIRSSGIAACVTLLLLAAVLCQLVLSYHVAVLLTLLALVLAARNSPRSALRYFVIFLIGSAVLALIHATLLASRPGSLIKVVGAMVGEPSVWPYVRMGEFSPVAGVLTLAALGWALYEIANRRAATDYALLAIAAVWVPLLMIGIFLWNMPSRYVAASVLPLLLCAFAFAQDCVERLRRRWAGSRGGARLEGALPAVIAVLVINPLAVAAVVNSGYANHPDHQGAAQFIRAQQLRPEDIIIAEDVLQQTYYLGSVDYWLISAKHARRFVERVDGTFVDFYTHTPVISSAAALDQLLARERDKRIFVIGSGENQEEKRRDMRGASLDEALHSPRFISVFTGRDQLTHVWRAVPRAAALSETKQLRSVAALPATASIEQAAQPLATQSSE